jgi:ligand-binding sensor domain-containing protein
VGKGAVQCWTDPNDINGLLYDGQYLWAATGGGVVCWKPDGTEPRLYTMSDGLASQAIRGIAQDGDGHIWVGYADCGSWSEYDGEGWHTYDTREKAVASRYKAMLTSLRTDPRLWSRRDAGDWLWASTSDGGVEAYDGSKWRVYGQREGVTQGTWLVAVATEGRVWAVGEGINTAEEGDRQWEDHSLPGEAPEDSAAADLTVDAQGRAWLAYTSRHRQGGGVGCLDAEASRWTIYEHALDSSIPRQVHGVEIEKDGTIWLCGEGGIALRRPGGHWEAIPLGDIVAGSFARSGDGRFWIGTAHGIWTATADGTDLRGPWLVPTSIIDNEINGLAMDDKGALWLGTPKGLSYIEANGKAGILIGEAIRVLAASPKGEIWAGTSGGLYVVQGDRSGRQVLDVAVVALAFDAQGQLWACTQDGQIGKVDSTGWQPKGSVAALAITPPRDMLIQGDGAIWLGTANGLGILSADGAFAWAGDADRVLKEDIRAMALGSDGYIWVATTGGLARRSPAGGWVRLTITSTGGGLRSTEIRHLLVDREETLWVATSAGLSARTAKTDWFYYDLPGVRTIWSEPSGIIWVGTQGGLYRLQRDLLVAVP